MRAGRPRSQQSAQENIYVIDDFITGVLHLLQPPETPLPLDGKRHIAFAQAWLATVDVAYARDDPPPKVKFRSSTRVTMPSSSTKSPV
jgi:hypothetical protein